MRKVKTDPPVELDSEYTDRYITRMEPRKRLAGVALRLFVERGYDAVGVQQIVEEAGLTKPTLYHHFTNKSGLLAELARRVEDRLFSVLAEATGAGGYSGDLPQDLERLVAGLLRFAAAYPEETRLLLVAQNGPSASEARLALAGVWARLSAEIERFFAAAAADHGNMRGREREYTVSLLGIVFAYVVLELDDRLEPDTARPHHIMRQFSYGIYT